MTEVAVRDGNAVDRPSVEQQAPLPATGLVVWANEARQASQIAQSLARTPFVPASLRDRNDPAITAANITAVILTGQELGLEPMAALRSVDIIQGTPALRAITLRAVVLGAGHDIWVAESTETRAIVRGRRKGSDQVQESVWTMDRARALALAGKDNWRKQPGAMLVARATSECARMIAADALLGMPYSVEELGDGDDGPLGPGSTADGPPAKTQRTARRRSSAAGAAASHRGQPPAEQPRDDAGPEPTFDEPAPESTSASEPAPAAESEKASPAQMRMIHASYNELGMADRDERLADVSGVVGRDVESTSDLTKDEAKRLLDDLVRRSPASEPSEDGGLFGEGAGS